MKEEHIFGKVKGVLGDKEFGLIFNQADNTMFNVIFARKCPVPKYADLTLYHIGKHDKVLEVIDSILPSNGPLIDSHTKGRAKPFEYVSFIITDHETKLPRTIALEGVKAIRAGEWAGHKMISILLFYENVVDLRVDKSSVQIEEL